MTCDATATCGIDREVAAIDYLVGFARGAATNRATRLRPEAIALRALSRLQGHPFVILCPDADGRRAVIAAESIGAAAPDAAARAVGAALYASPQITTPPAPAPLLAPLPAVLSALGSTVPRRVNCDAPGICEISTEADDHIGRRASIAVCNAGVPEP